MANELHDLLASWEAVPLQEPTGYREPGGWPVEPADITVLDPEGRVSVCTLGDGALGPAVASALEAATGRAPAVVGPMATENIGVQKLVRNVLSSAAIDTVVLCGPETGGSAPTGHFAGDALLRLVTDGVEPGTRRIVGARGRRPFVHGLMPEEISAFRRRVRVLDLRGVVDAHAIAAASADDGAQWVTGPREQVRTPAETVGQRVVVRQALVRVDVGASRRAYVPDPAGYFLVFSDTSGRRLVLEHYTTEGHRTAILTGEHPGSLAAEAIERGLVSRLDHAVYLGRELWRARHALDTGTGYVQDATPEAGG